MSTDPNSPDSNVQNATSATPAEASLEGVGEDLESMGGELDVMQQDLDELERELEKLD